MALKNDEETRLQKRVQAYLKSLGAYEFKVHGSAYMKAGIPDIIACLQGRFVGVECKVGYNKPTELQKAHGRQIVKAGGTFIVAYSVADVEEGLKNANFNINS